MGGGVSDGDGEEFNQLSDEARADAAPVVPELAYQPRKAWKPGICVGFIINTTKPVARVKWPKGRDAKEFFARMKDALEKVSQRK
jgi:hypothetical protein